MADTIQGYIERILFRNEENGYTVLEVVSGGEETACFGNVPYVNQGETVRVTGEFVSHPVYGRQLKIASCEVCAPQDRLAMERYLASGAIKGIGLALATRITDKFGDDTYRILEEEPERLAEVRGISTRKAMEIADRLNDQRQMRRAMLFLQQYGISGSLAVKIYQRYEEGLYDVLRENPYRLAEDIHGVGFRIADEIARRGGVAENSRFRIACGLLYVLQQAGQEGHTCLPRPLLFERAGGLLGIEENQFEEPMMDLLLERKIVNQEMEGTPYVYEARTYYTELATARMLTELSRPFPADTDKISRFVEKESEGRMELDGLQLEAVTKAIGNGVFVLTGGPGTGKTTTINLMIRYFVRERMQFLLAAPTGRAAKRMTEATGYEAQTIHRLLELSGESYGGDGEGLMRFARDASNPLEADAIIIDEMSMVDLYLMHALLTAVPVGTRLILVGDVNQLPSVGAGCVLKDMIKSGRFPMVTLTHIFRQAAESDIVLNAHRIHQGKQLALDKNSSSRDFFFLQRTDPQIILESVLYLVEKKLPPYVQAKPYDVQVLAPMRKGVLGVTNLNAALQQRLNPPGPDKKEKEYKDMVFRQGDKVMQIRNNYQLEWETRNSFDMLVDRGVGVFNGDIGLVSEIDMESEQMTVVFDECREVRYPFGLLDELELAYAVTIHKSQGSEYPAVVLPLLSGPRMLLNNNLLYTAVTRARKCVTIVGSGETVQRMIRNRDEQKRYSGLQARLSEVS